MMDVYKSVFYSQSQAAMFAARLFQKNQRVRSSYNSMIVTFAVKRLLVARGSEHFERALPPLSVRQNQCEVISNFTFWGCYYDSQTLLIIQNVHTVHERQLYNSFPARNSRQRSRIVAPTASMGSRGTDFDAGAECSWWIRSLSRLMASFAAAIPYKVRLGVPRRL